MPKAHATPLSHVGIRMSFLLWCGACTVRRALECQDLTERAKNTHCEKDDAEDTLSADFACNDDGPMDMLFRVLQSRCQHASKTNAAATECHVGCGTSYHPRDMCACIWKIPRASKRPEPHQKLFQKSALWASWFAKPAPEAWMPQDVSPSPHECSWYSPMFRLFILLSQVLNQSLYPPCIPTIFS